MLAHMYTRCPCREDIPPFDQWRAKVGKVDDVIDTGRHSETYTLCEIRCKFNQLGLRLFKAFMNTAYRRYISIILMYLKTNAIFRYRRAQMRTFQDEMRW